MTSPSFILEILQKSFPNEKIDISKLYHPSAMDKYPQANKGLGNPEIASIKNPVFNRAMHQIKRLCNKLILEGIIDKNTEVNVEVAGEINSASYRRALSLWQKEQETIRAWAKKEIINTYPKECRAEINPTETDVIKYIFWKEQSHQCLYTKKQMLFYTILMLITCTMPYFLGMAGVIYLIVSSILGAIFLGYSVLLFKDDDLGRAKKLFWYSIIYLFGIFLTLIMF